MGIKATTPSWVDNPKALDGFIDNYTEAVLGAFGDIGVGIIKESIENKDFSGNTRKSIMWATARNNSATSSEYVLTRPSKNGVVFIGSADPTASYIEYGTGPHTSASGSDKFVEEIKAWAKARNIPDKYVGGIITNIRKYGTRAYPYINKAKSDLQKEVAKYTKEFAVEFVARFNALRDKGRIGKWNLEVIE